MQETPDGEVDFKELPERFTGRGEVRGFDFELVQKSTSGYMYKKSYSGLVTFEVFERRINKRFNCVSYPRSKQFGILLIMTRL